MKGTSDQISKLMNDKDEVQSRMGNDHYFNFSVISGNSYTNRNSMHSRKHAL